MNVYVAGKIILFMLKRQLLQNKNKKNMQIDSTVVQLELKIISIKTYKYIDKKEMENI